MLVYLGHLGDGKNKMAEYEVDWKFANVLSLETTDCMFNNTGECDRTLLRHQIRKSQVAEYVKNYGLEDFDTRSHTICDEEHYLS